MEKFKIIDYFMNGKIKDNFNVLEINMIQFKLPKPIERKRGIPILLIHKEKLFCTF